MTTLQVNDLAPDFLLSTTSGTTVNLEYYKGKNLVLYFYPKDNTPGCTLEAQQFNDSIAEFTQLNAVVLGVSKDNISTHQKFKTDFCLKFDLAFDSTGNILTNYGVFKEKSMFGKSFLAINRSTFIINPQSKIIAIWKNVNVKSHCKEVLDVLRNNRV